ncbi:MAG: UvrD-helicase domain-containing protein, partial [Lachnospiraceae bacterium]|nr:UvrD-helicase domain-containing protein [Lachnospiraceae bacterium]
MNLLEQLNPEQQRAVLTTEGPVLILAGAGSGKTRVLVHRVANLMANGVAPYHIMAITFTNKAAGEMRERINNLIGTGAEQIWVATFHSSCVRILRRYGDRIGYGTNFSIYDTDDTKTVMKEVLKKLNIDTKKFKERYFLNAISSAKNEMITAEEYALNAGSDLAKSRIAGVYREYQARMRANNAMDFDDLLVECVNLLKQDPEVLNYYQTKFEYIMVDEYQDTNTVQFELVRLLAGGRQNLCVVGDDDQSIYKFRGANIYNILNFEQQFPDATVIKLEQNYRSTKFILDTANGVIRNNEGRKDKALWTENEQGEKVKFKQFDSAYEEAQFIAMDINSKVRKRIYDYKDCAVLYRTNAQSRLLEEKFIVENIPYKIVGGVNFYSRKEVKDILAYLKTIDNAQDDLAVRRIINVPKRGIGATSIDKVQDYATALNMPFFDALLQLQMDPALKKLEKKVEPFVLFIQLMRSQLPDLGVAGLIREIIDQTGYEAELEAEGTDEAAARIENIEEFYSKAVAYEEEHEDATLGGFLEEVALIADIDSLDESEDYVVLMTLHAAKGLEFPNVYMAGMEDGLFPSYMSITADDSDAEIEEERRLCYVGITRAMKQLTMTSAKARMVRGETQYGAVSRFVKEIPDGLLDGEVYEQKQRFFPDFLDDVPT